MIVDCHQHFWDLEKVEYSWLVPDYGPIYRTFKPAELEPQLAAAGVDRTALVQSANSFEDTDSMLAHAAAQAWIGAVVGAARPGFAQVQRTTVAPCCFISATSRSH